MKHIYTQTIGEQIVSLISTNFKTSLGLKIIQYGDLAFYTASDLSDLAADCPAVLVKSKAFTIARGSIGSLVFDGGYHIVYIHRIADEPGDKEDALFSIAEYFLNPANTNGDTPLSIADISDMSFRSVLVTDIDSEPEEDGLLDAYEMPLTAASFDLSVIYQCKHGGGV